MLKVNKLTDYAVVISLYLAEDVSKFHSASSIAQALFLPLPTVSKVLKLLLKANLMISVAGSQGGYRLLVQPKELNLAQILQAIEGGVSLTECLSSNLSCSYNSNCQIKGHWGVIQTKFLEVLQKVTIYDLLQSSSKLIVNTDMLYRK